MKKIFNFINGTQMWENLEKHSKNYIFILNRLHLYGTYEQGEEEEGEVCLNFWNSDFFHFFSQVYEVLNIRSLKQATPNLRVINLWGVRWPKRSFQIKFSISSFVDDGHVEAFSSNCIQLAVMSVNFCPKVQGSCIKILLQRWWKYTASRPYS